MLVCSKLTKEEKRYCAELYAKYRRFMYSVAVQYASHENPVDDIVQNASVALVQHSSKLRGMDDPACFTYIRLIIQSVATDQYRRVKRDVRIKDQIESFDFGCARSAEEDYMDYADYELLDEVLDSLEERDSTLLRGKFCLRLSDKEVAEKVGCKPESVRTLVMRAKHRAQDKLIKEGFKHDEI